MAREYFCAYHSLLDSLEPFTDEECGRLFRASLIYSKTKEETEFEGNERYLWPTIKGTIDRDNTAYEERCAANRENGAKGGRPKSDKNHTVLEETESNQTASLETEKTQEKEKEEEKEEDKEEDKDKEKDIISSSSKKSVRHTYGEYKHVLLTDDQVGRLLKDLGGAEMDRCIRYVDEAAQKTGNKNGWKDWNLVIRTCHREGWGLRGQNTISATRPAAHARDPVSSVAPIRHIEEFIFPPPERKEGE